MAGGIGITPIMSLIEEDIYESSKTRRKISHRLQCLRLVWIMPFGSEAELFLDKFLAYREQGEINPCLPTLELLLHITRGVMASFAAVTTFLSKPEFPSLMDNSIEKNKQNGAYSILVFA